MADRKAELERKKARLQAMREEKKRKEEEKKRKELEGSPSHPAQPDLRTETEQMLRDLGIPETVAHNQSTSSTTAVGGTASSDLSRGATPTHKASPPRKASSLSLSKVTQTNIPPKDCVVYCKETQTPGQEVVEREARAKDYYESRSSSSNTPSHGNSPYHTYGSHQKFHYPNLEWDDMEFFSEDEDGEDIDIDAAPAKASRKKKSKSESNDDPATPAEETKPTPVIELSEEEKDQIAHSEDFLRFIEKSSRYMERALCEQVDLFTDYVGEDGDDVERGPNEGEMLKLNRQFSDERWSKYRNVSCLDWSVIYPELLAASYFYNEDAPNDPDGVVLVWNMKYKKDTPEFIFHGPSAATSTCFAKFHPNLVVGGMYSGQIVLWDNRSNKRTPVQRTPLSSAAHTHPVYCVNVVGTQNAHNLISVSTDGKLCSWNLDMLSQPQESIELQHRQTKSLAPTGFSFLSGDVNNFVVGGEEGAVYTACRHGSKAGITDVFEGHQGPLTGIDCHTAPGQIDFSQYFLSSSFDWTIKLWNIKENRALHSFEDNGDYVYDVRWSPVHPALFASVDGMGRLDMWNLNKDTEVPTASTRVSGNVSLNKCLWHQSGHHIAAGDDMGTIHLYDVAETLSVPKVDEWSKFVHTLQDLKNMQDEQDEDNAKLGSGSGLI